MWLIIIWIIIGGAVGGGVSWFNENRSSLGQAPSVIIGAVAGVCGAYAFLIFGGAFVNEGPLPIVSFLAAAIASAIVVFIVGLIKR